MKERVLSSLVGLVLLAIVVLFYNTVVFNIVMGLVGLIAVYELLNATKMIKHRGFATVATAFAILMPFVQNEQVRPWVPAIVLLLLVAFFALVLKYYNVVTFEQACTTLFIGIVVPLFFSSAVYLRIRSGVVGGLYYLLLALGSAWLCDTGAYFAGYFFGKHKMAPNVSPKKTVEGAIGGLLTAVGLNLVLAFAFTKGMAALGHTIAINYLLVGIVSPFLAAFGILGDLIASVVKRQHNVKDYGHIMPGHGGIMDRFDSVLLTLPAVYITSLYLQIVTIL